MTWINSDSGLQIRKTVKHSDHPIYPHPISKCNNFYKRIIFKMIMSAIKLYGDSTVKGQVHKHKWMHLSC